MKQLILEIDEETEARIYTAASVAGISSQEWLQHIIEEKTMTLWPDSVKALAGVWGNTLFSEKLRANEGQDIPREDF